MLVPETYSDITLLAQRTSLGTNLDPVTVFYGPNQTAVDFIIGEIVSDPLQYPFRRPYWYMVFAHTSDLIQSVLITIKNESGGK